MLKRLWTTRWLPAVLTAVALAGMVGGIPSCSQENAAHPAAANLNFVLKDMNGQDVSLASFKGRPLLLNFWATWCGPCKAEIPEFMELARQHQAEHLAVLGVSVDDSPEDIRAFAKEHQVTYPLLVGSPHHDLRTIYEANDLIPVTWLIRPDGTILEKAEGIHQKDWFESHLKTMF